MNKETKKYLKNNAVMIIYAIMIIVVVIFSNIINSWAGPGTAEFIIFLIALLILLQVFTQALQHEPEKTRNKIIMISFVILAILGILGIVVFFLMI